jgi:hypothetical protein
MIAKEKLGKHSFDKDLDESYRIAQLSFWEEVYHARFPPWNIRYEYHEKDSEAQLSGIDRTLHFPNGDLIHIDEKVRTRSKVTGHVYTDIALEIYSDAKLKTPGWIVKPTASHFFTYVILPLGRAYIYPAMALQEIWLERNGEWLGKYGGLSSASFRGDRSWGTYFCPVPPQEIARALDRKGVMPGPRQSGDPWLYQFKIPEGEDKEGGHE